MILGNSPAIEDVVAEVFVAFWMAPEKFDAGRGSLLGFLRLKAKGRSIDMVRSESSRRRRETNERAITTDVPVECDQETCFNPNGHVLLHHAVSLLPAIEREPICLAYFDGMTYTAVADYLSLPEGTVKSRIRSGLRRLAMSDEVKAATPELRRRGQTDPVRFAIGPMAELLISDQHDGRVGDRRAGSGAIDRIGTFGSGRIGTRGRL
jgi:RNA polymerase sigma factor (sigma-70 family)